MTLIILSQRYTRDSRIIKQAAENLGHETFRMITSNLPDWIYQKELAVYCEGFMAEYVSQQTNLAILRPLIDSLAQVPIEYTKRIIQYITKNEFKEFSKPTFIKPADQNFFEAGVYDSHTQINGWDDLPPNEPIFISETVNFIDEYRLFCNNNSVLSGSLYIKNKEFIGDNDNLPEIEKSVMEFGNCILKECSDLLPPGVVIDIGRLDNGELALIEFNPVWASGIYGTNPNSAISAILSSCIQRKDMKKKFAKFEIF